MRGAVNPLFAPHVMWEDVRCRGFGRSALHRLRDSKHRKSNDNTFAPHAPPSRARRRRSDGRYETEADKREGNEDDEREIHWTTHLVGQRWAPQTPARVTYAPQTLSKHPRLHGDLREMMRCRKWKWIRHTPGRVCVVAAWRMFRRCRAGACWFFCQPRK